MKVQIYGKNVTITPGMQEKVETKLKFRLINLMYDYLF